jgi:(2Fe-2S) ferredoxin
MKVKKAQPATHKIKGEFLGFIPKPGSEFKYMQLQVGERIIPVKLAKELQELVGEKLVEGDQLAVYLEGSGLGLESKLKLKTDHIEKLNASDDSSVLASPSASKSGKILLCYNSSCVKRGGKKLYYALIETLQKLGLQDEVKIEMTGCQKQCKKAPSFILMPGGVTHSYVHPEDLPSLLEAHYLATPQLSNKK